jgi:hypothetical protein
MNASHVRMRAALLAAALSAPLAMVPVMVHPAYGQTVTGAKPRAIRLRRGG